MIEIRFRCCRKQNLRRHDFSCKVSKEGPLVVQPSTPRGPRFSRSPEVRFGPRLRGGAPDPFRVRETRRRSIGRKILWNPFFFFSYVTIYFEVGGVLWNVHLLLLHLPLSWPCVLFVYWDNYVLRKILVLSVDVSRWGTSRETQEDGRGTLNRGSFLCSLRRHRHSMVRPLNSGFGCGW